MKLLKLMLFVEQKDIDIIKNDYELIDDKYVLKEITKDDVVNNDLLEKNDVKPTVNVDSDSVVVNENVITDDEFFDDFFGDDE